MEPEDYDMTSSYDTIYTKYKKLGMKSKEGVLLGQELASYYINQESCYNKNRSLYIEADVNLPYLRGDKILEILQDDTYGEMKKREYIKCTLDATFAGEGKINGFNNWFTNFSIKQIYEKDIVVNATYPKDSFPASIFSIKIANTSDFSYIYNEAMVGVCALNNMIARVPNFVYTYALKDCSSFYSYQNKPKICTSAGNVPYLLTEEIHKGKKFSELLRDESFSDTTIINNILQVINALYVANSSYGFTHYNMTCDNIICTASKNKLFVTFPINEGTYYLGVNDYVAKIINYENASITYDGLQFGISAVDNLVRDRSRCELVDIATFLSSIYKIVNTRKRVAEFIKSIYEKFFNSIGVFGTFNIQNDSTDLAKRLYNLRKEKYPDQENYYISLYKIIESVSDVNSLFLTSSNEVNSSLIYNYNEDAFISSSYRQDAPIFTNTSNLAKYIDSLSVLSPQDKVIGLQKIKYTQEQIDKELKYIENRLINDIGISNWYVYIRENRSFLLSIRQFIDKKFISSQNSFLIDRIKELIQKSTVVRYKKDTLTELIEQIKNLKQVSDQNNAESLSSLRIDNFYKLYITRMERYLYELKTVIIPEQTFTMQKLLKIAEKDRYIDVNVLEQYKKEYFFNILSNGNELETIDKLTNLSGPTLLYFFKNFQHPSNTYKRNILLLGERHDNYNFPKCGKNTVGIYEFILQSSSKNNKCIDFFNETGHKYAHGKTINAGGVIKDMYDTFVALDSGTISKYVRYHSVDYRRGSINGKSVDIGDKIPINGEYNTTYDKLQINEEIYNSCVDLFLGDFTAEKTTIFRTFFEQIHFVFYPNESEESIRKYTTTYLNSFFENYRKEYTKRFNKMDWKNKSLGSKLNDMEEYKRAYRYAAKNRYNKYIAPYIFPNKITNVNVIFITVTANIMDVLAIARFFTIYDSRKRPDAYNCKNYNKYLIVGTGEAHTDVYYDFLKVYGNTEASLALRAPPGTQCITFPEPFSIF